MANSSCLWTKARENLPVDVKEWLASLEQGIQPNATAAEQIDALIEQTTKKHKDLEKSNHRFSKYFDKIIHWLDKVKGIGDVISSFDPVHAALPWAAFRFALQAALAEREQAESVLELLSSTPHFVFSGRVLEMVYTTESMHVGETQDDMKLSQQCLNSLHEELIKLYSALLVALKYCYSISSKHKVKRKATAIFNSSEVVSIHKDLKIQHKKVITCGENCHKILNHTLSRKSLDLLQKIQPTLTELGDRLQELLVRIDESERLKTLGAISSILFRAHHDEVSQKRTTGTCEWILKRETFIRWEESDSSVTILYGNPGAGKTFLVSRVVDYSIESAKTDQAVAFFYCKRDEENRRNPREILRSILRQLSSPVKETEGGMIHVAIKDLPNRLELKGTTFDISICESLIRKLIEDYHRTTIILDALDECDRATREELMRVLSNLTNGSSKLRVFISSRQDEDIRRHFKGTPMMEMQATDNEEDISSFVEDKLFRDSRWVNTSPEFEKEIRARFHEKSLGMFQWAALQVDQIRRLKLWSETNIRHQIEISPTELKAAYDVVWSQMEEMSSYEQQLARRALQWVLCAFRPLKTTELSLIMLIEHDSGTMEGDTALTSETIQSICGNLLVYDRQSNVWRFSHLSAREYIEMHHYNIIESHNHVAISSIRFLQRQLARMPRDMKPSLEPEPTPWVIPTRRPDPVLTVQCDYIVKYVLRHAQKLDLPTYRHSELSNLLRNFFEPISEGSSSFKSWKRVFRTMRKRASGMQNLFSRSRSISRISTPLQVMSIYGLFHILRDLWEKAGGELDICPMSTSSPLALAIQYGHESIWRFILLAKAKFNKGTPGPLTAAIQYDNEKAFEALLEAEADVNYDPITENHEILGLDPPLKAALRLTTKQNRRYIIQRLLDGGADVNLRIGSETAMELAIWFSDEEVVKMLLGANTKVYNPNHFLSLAARNRQFNLVPLCVDLGANVEQPWEGVLPLTWALSWENLSAIQFLLEMPGTSIDLSCQDHREAIISTMSHLGAKNNFAFLFRSNPHIDWMDCEVDTLKSVLELYPKYEYELRGLGLTGSDFALQCNEGTAHRQLSLVHALLNARGDPSVSVNFSSGGTLSAAAFHGRLHHARSLLYQEQFYLSQEQISLFPTALFTVMSGHLGIVSRIHPDNRRNPSGTECLCVKFLEVLLRLFNEHLSAYMPIYDFLDPLIPPVYINGGGYEINSSCQLSVKGYFGYFSPLWFFTMWDLQYSTSPQLPLGSQLRKWQFPGILPPRCFIVTKVTALPKVRQAYFSALSIRGNRSQFIIVPARREIHSSLSHGLEDGRWKRYKPESFGVMRYPYQYKGTVSSSTEAQAVCGKTKAYLTSCYRNRFASVLLAFVVVLLSFFMALPQFTQRT